MQRNREILWLLPQQRNSRLHQVQQLAGSNSWRQRKLLQQLTQLQLHMQPSQFPALTLAAAQQQQQQAASLQNLTALGFFNPYTTQALLGSPLAQVQQAANAHQQPNAAHAAQAAQAAHAALGAAAHMNPAHHPLLGQIQGIRQGLTSIPMTLSQPMVTMSASPSIFANSPTTATSNMPGVGTQMVDATSYLSQGFGPIPGAPLSKGQQRFTPY